MAVQKEAYQKKIEDIGLCEDETQRRTLLTELMNESNELFTERDTLTQSETDLKTKNKELRDANTDLYLQVRKSLNTGSGSGNDQDDQDDNQDPDNKKEKELTFEALFDEKGHLK